MNQSFPQSVFSASDRKLSVSEKKIYSPEDLKSIQRGPLPGHIAIIMDGNRRWETKHNNRCSSMNRDNNHTGHHAGANTLLHITRCAKELNIKTLTLYAFSTENWNRSKEEVSFLLDLMTEYLKKKQNILIEEGIKLHTIGNLNPLPEKLKHTIQESVAKTNSGNKLNLVLAINYGSRNEILRTFQKMYKEISSKKIRIEDIDEKFLSEYLDTAHLGDPDLLIRTSGEMRISNFLLWQIAYSEIYVTNTLWPDFKEQDLLHAIKAYQKRERRIGT